MSDPFDSFDKTQDKSAQGKISFDALYNRTLKFLSFRPRSEKEVLDYLTKPRFGKYGKKEPLSDEKTANQIIEKLKDYKFVSDLAFAKWWIESRKKGLRILSLELKQKGISKEIIDRAKSSFDSAGKESILLSNLIERKLKTLSKDPKGYQKMLGYLMRKGFDYETTKKALESKIKLGELVDE